MYAYLSDPLIKRACLDRITDCQKHGSLVTTNNIKHWDGRKGDVTGCLFVEDYRRFERYEFDLGIPLMVGAIYHAIFQWSDEEFARAWARFFLESIEPGQDLSLVGWKFLVAAQCQKLSTAADDHIEPIIYSIHLLQKVIDGQRVLIKDTVTIQDTPCYVAFKISQIIRLHIRKDEDFLNSVQSYVYDYRVSSTSMAFLLLQEIADAPFAH